MGPKRALLGVVAARLEHGVRCLTVKSSVLLGCLSSPTFDLIFVCAVTLGGERGGKKERKKEKVSKGIQEK